MRKIAGLLLGLLLGAPAQAQLSAGWAGMVYPAFGATYCSPDCVSASADWVVPAITYSGSGGSELVFQWIGINANGTSPVGYLGQFGTAAGVTTGGVASYYAWQELWCAGLPSPCYAVTQIGGFTINAGDHIHASMVCQTHCTADDAAQTWTVSMVNLTSGVTWNNSGVDFNWPLGLGHAIFVQEAAVQSGPATRIGNVGTVKFSNIRVNGAPPAWTNAKGRFVYNNTSSGGNLRVLWPSLAFGPFADNFNTCYSTGNYALSLFCPGSGMSGSTNSLGGN